MTYAFMYTHDCGAEIPVEATSHPATRFDPADYALDFPACCPECGAPLDHDAVAEADDH